MDAPRRLAALAGLALLVAAGAVGCEHALVVPPGAVTVHAIVTSDAVRLEPRTVHAGMIYLITESDGTELVLIGGGGGPSGSLTDAQLDAVLHGDLMNTYQTSGFPSGGDMGSASELGKLEPGKYLFLPYGIVSLEPGGYDSIPADVMGVLEVVP